VSGSSSNVASETGIQKKCGGPLKPSASPTLPRRETGFCGGYHRSRHAPEPLQSWYLATNLPAPDSNRAQRSDLSVVDLGEVVRLYALQELDRAELLSR
jgi:hypothetical protein